MRKIIIVDDESSSISLAHWLCNDIEILTNGQYAGVLLGDGVIISESLPKIKTLVEKIKKEGDTVAGILIDFVDETHKIVNAGEILLEKLKSDPALKDIPVVVYTGKFVPQFSSSVLVEKGALSAFRRELTGHGAKRLCRQVLKAFKIPYRSGGTGSTGPKKE